MLDERNPIRSPRLFLKDLIIKLALRFLMLNTRPWAGKTLGEDTIARCSQLSLPAFVRNRHGVAARPGCKARSLSAATAAHLLYNPSVAQNSWFLLGVSDVYLNNGDDLLKIITYANDILRKTLLFLLLSIFIAAILP
jgi:hypothetical protein